MSKVDRKTVEYVAKLARIDLADSEKEAFSQQLSKILDYIDKLKQLDTENIEPLRNLHQSRDVLRKDQAKPSGKSEKILKNSPLTEGDYFKTPKVIE